MTTHLDWLLLIDRTEEAFSHLKQLLKEGICSVRFLPGAVQEKRLWEVYWEQRSAQRLRGQQLLYFQYPFFQIPTNSGQEIQPLLRWPAQLEPPVKGSSYWVLTIQGRVDTDISYTLNVQAEYNKKWCAWANKQYAFDWEKALDDCLLVNGNALRALSQLAQLMTEKTDWQTNTVHPALRSQSSIAFDAESSETSSLVWLASLGLNSEHWSNVTDHGEVNCLRKLEGEESLLDQLGLLKLDPHQYESVVKRNKHAFTIVEGGQASGKTHTLIENIKAHLLNDTPCLIVAREKTSLANIKKRLDKEGLGNLVSHWHNESTDLAVFQARVQSSDKVSSTISPKAMTEWTALLGRQNRTRRLFEQLYDASRKQVWEAMPWYELLGHYLQEARQEGKELLASQLSAGHFQLTKSEFEEIRSSIAVSKPLYDAVGSINHPFANLNAAIFVHQSFEESGSFIQGTTEKFLKTAKRLHQSYVRKQSQYGDQLVSYYESYYIELREQLQKVQALSEDAENEFGKDIMASGENTLKLYGRFSKRFKKAVDHKQLILDAYEELKLLHDKITAFTFEWPEAKPKNILTVLAPAIGNYQKELNDWRSTFSTKIDDELIRLNHKTAIEALKVSSSILTLEQELEVFIDEVNASGLYQLPFHSKTLTLSRQQKYLEEIMGQLERSRDGLSDYKAFYDWQKNWVKLPEFSRKTIQALLRSLPKNWLAAFSSWYLNECLSQAYEPFPIIADKAVEEYNEQINNLRSRNSAIINKKWEPKYNLGLTKLKNITKNRQHTFVDFLHAGGEYLNLVSPIALASPDVAHLLAPYYKLVFLENAQSLSSESVLPLAVNSEQMTTFVDKEEVAFETDGAATFFEHSGVSITTLEDTYELNFAQRAQALGNRIVYHQLEGRFNEEDQSNEVEAFEILKILNKIQKTPQQTYPSVGVICMTKGQRNKVQELFFRIKKDRHTGVEILQHLERNGLKVLTASEIIGQRFDHVVFSAVYGPIDIKGHLSPLLSDLNNGLELATLSTLERLMIPESKWDVLSSMPQEELKERANWHDQKGEQHFARLLELFYAISNSDDESSFEQSKFWENKPSKQNKRMLDKELAYRLSQQLPEWNFELSEYKGAGHLFLMASSPDGEKTALLPDGFLAASLYTTIDWEYEQQQRLILAGYQIQSFSTESLWKNPSYTCQRIVDRLRSFVEEEE